jgi:hypothetical protein
MEKSNVLKVSVTASGEITANGRPVTLEQLTAKFSKSQKAGGSVWYHRENSRGEPHPNAMKVIELAAKNNLPIRLSSKPDFSDVVDAEGFSRP